MNEPVSKSDVDGFMHRWKTGEGANEDTAWRAQHMMNNLMDTYTVVSSRFDGLRNGIEAIINEHGSLNVSADSLDDSELLIEITRLVLAGKTSNTLAAAMQSPTPAPIAPRPQPQPQPIAGVPRAAPATPPNQGTSGQRPAPQPQAAPQAPVTTSAPVAPQPQVAPQPTTVAQQGQAVRNPART